MSRRHNRARSFTVGHHAVTLRAPQLRDAQAWSAARLANRTWIEGAFPAWGDDWPAEQSEVAWLERWWHLRHDAVRGRARPFVVLLNGAFAGEVGVDAIDDTSGSGEGSAWMVREHGPPEVLIGTVLAIFDAAFDEPHPVDRLAWPLASSGRKGFTSSLIATGHRIEATLPRRVRGKGFIDHDLWTVHNTAADRAVVAEKLRQFPPVTPPPEPHRPWPVRALVHWLLRELRRSLRRLVGALRSAQPPPSLALGSADAWLIDETSRRGRGRRGALRWRIVRGDTRIGALTVDVDPGTDIAQITASVVDEAERAALAAALRAALDAVADGRYGAVRPSVRVPLVPASGVVADAGLLTELGLHLAATFPGNAEGPRRWKGEQRWEADSDPGSD